MGKLREKINKKTRGFVLLDLLVALLIMSIALVSLFSTISMGARGASRMKRSVVDLITQRNEDVQNKEIFFKKE